MQESDPQNIPEIVSENSFVENRCSDFEGCHTKKQALQQSEKPETL